MPRPVAEFPKGCSSQKCSELRRQIKEMRRRNEIVLVKSRKSGKLVASRIRNKGGLGWDRLPVKLGGPAFHFKRCKEFEWKSAITKRQETDTCTNYHTVYISEDTMRCYRQVVPLMIRSAKGKRGGMGRGGKALSPRIFALLACSQSGRFGHPRVTEPMTPSIVSAVTELPYQKVRRTMETGGGMNKAGLCVCDTGKKVKFLNENQCRVPPKYLAKFVSWYNVEKKRKKGVMKPTPTPTKWKYVEKKRKKR